MPLSKKRGIAIAIKNSIQFTQLKVNLDVSGRFIILVCEINKAVYTLVNVYLPNYKQLSFLKKKIGMALGLHIELRVHNGGRSLFSK